MAIAVGAVLAFVVTAGLSVMLQQIAPRFGLIDQPGGRRAHTRPTPLIGGLVLFLTVAPIGLWLLPLTKQALGLGLAAIVIVVAGVADDIKRLRWPFRLAAQILAALILVWVGHIEVQNIGEVFGVPARPLGLFSPILSIIGVVGVINAVNMVDGVDGLAGSVVIVACVVIAACGQAVGNDTLVKGLILLAAGLAGFLTLNLRAPWMAQARIYLGNAGSELLGLVIAAACIRLTQNPTHPVGVEIAPFLIAPALIDCLTLMVRRWRMKTSPFIGDRNHLHHMLLDAGLSPTGVVAVIAGSTLVIGVAAIVAMRLHVPPPWFTAAFIVLWVGYFILTHSRDVTVARLSRVLGTRNSLGTTAIGALDAARHGLERPKSLEEVSEKA